MKHSAQQAGTGGAGFEALFSPVDVGGMRLANGLAALPVFTGYAYGDGTPSPLLLEHYWSLARSGVSLVTVGNVAVSADGATSRRNLRLDHDRFIPGLSRLARVIREGGAVPCLQLNHAGRLARTERPLMPAAMDAKHLAFDVASLKAFMETFPVEERFGLTRMVMQKAASWQEGGMGPADRQRLVEAFASAAARAVRAGFGAVELHGATGYLLSQFLSSYTNRAADGSLIGFEERAHLPLQVFRAVKQAVPSGIPLGFRLLVREWTPDGIDLDEALRLAVLLKAEGAAYVSVSAGTYNSIFNPEVRRITARPAYLRDECAAIRSGAGIAVISAGRTVTPSVAAGILAAGAADVVGLGRSLLADIDWVRKARDGGKVRACIDCFSCLRRIVLEQGLNCVRRPMREQRRIDLECAFLGRSLTRSLVVAATPSDVALIRQSWARRLPGREAGRVTFLVLHPAGGDSVLTSARDEFEALALRTWAQWGLPGEDLAFIDRPAGAAPDDQVQEQASEMGAGVVVLCRGAESWRRRVAARRIGFATSVLGEHPAPHRVLVAVDLSEVSLLALRYVRHAYLGRAGYGFTFLHVPDNGRDKALGQWEEMKAILGWDEDAVLTLAPRQAPVAAAIADELHRGGYGRLVMGRRGMGGLKRLLLGSVSEAVLSRVTNQSVTLVG